MASIPTEEGNDQHSTTLNPIMERAFNEMIREECAGQSLDDVDEANAGLLLSIIGRLAPLFRSAGLPVWPNQLLNRLNCDEFVEQRGIVEQLANVHRLGAYAWFVERVIATPPPTLLDFFFPLRNGFADGRISPVSVKFLESGSKTAPFKPRLEFFPDRLPFNVKMADSLLEEMKAHFEDLLDSGPFKEAAQRPAPEAFIRAYDHLKKKCRQWNQAMPVVQESQVAELSALIRDPVMEALIALDCQTVPSYTQVMTTDGIVVADWVIFGSAKEPAVVGEDKRPVVGQHYMAIIPQRLTSGPPLKFFDDEGAEILDEFWGVEAILGKIAWYATNNHDISKRPSWGVIFSGDQIMAVHMVHLLDINDAARVAMYVSPAMPATNPDFSILPMLVYMTLTSRNETELAKLRRRIAIEVPTPPATLVPRSPPLPSSASSAQNLSTADGIGVFANGASPTFLRRVADVRAIVNHNLSPKDMQNTDAKDDWPLLEVPSPPTPVQGGIGSVYRTQLDVVLKYAHPETDAWRAVAHEALVYQQLQAHEVPSVPRCHGLFASKSDYVLALSDNGQEIQAFSELDAKQRTTLYRTLQLIHLAGITHGDFMPMNVVVKSGRAFVIDFSHSTIGHRCPGPEACPELMEAAYSLGGND